MHLKSNAIFKWVKLKNVEDVDFCGRIYTKKPEVTGH
jgi:hypothetical protein